MGDEWRPNFEEVIIGSIIIIIGVCYGYVAKKFNLPTFFIGVYNPF